MPIAALPKYFDGISLATASPGLRFGMYLALWGVDNRTRAALWTTHDINYRVTGRDKQERAFNDENKTSALNQATRLTVGDRKLIAALSDRQAALARPLEASGELLPLDAVAVAPFTTGLGNEHPLENGFAFLNPYGVPYLPGSGVKGVLRQTCRELARGDWGGTHGWSEENRYPLPTNGAHMRNPRSGELGRLSMLDVLFGRATESGESEHVRGVLSFWDVIPQPDANSRDVSLMVEIMTPHQGHYYQQNAQMGSTSPHDSGQPVPISFLTVPPGWRFAFHVRCDLARLARIAPDLAENGRWKELLEHAFAHAFAWCGFGAKTAVGYGAMQVDERALAQRREQEQARLEAAAEAKRLAKLSPVERSIAEALQEKVDQGMRDSVFLVQQIQAGRWTESETPEVAARIKSLMQDEKTWKENSAKPEKDKDFKRTQVVLKILQGGGHA